MADKTPAYKGSLRKAVDDAEYAAARKKINEDLQAERLKTIDRLDKSDSDYNEIHSGGPEQIAYNKVKDKVTGEGKDKSVARQNIDYYDRIRTEDAVMSHAPNPPESYDRWSKYHRQDILDSGLSEAQHELYLKWMKDPANSGATVKEYKAYIGRR